MSQEHLSRRPSLHKIPEDLGPLFSADLGAKIVSLLHGFLCGLYNLQCYLVVAMVMFIGHSQGS